MLIHLMVFLILLESLVVIGKFFLVFICLRPAFSL